MLLMLLLPVGEDENSSSMLGGREVAGGNLAANGCDGCNGCWLRRCGELLLCLVRQRETGLERGLLGFGDSDPELLEA